MNSPLSVSSLNEQIKTSLETTFSFIYVEGEVSNLTYHTSGHIYFSIKDEKSTISCVMFRGNAQYLKFRLEVGQKIVISGSLTVYTPRGNYQLLCSKIEPSGVGALALAYEQLKTKLQIKGYFDSDLKKPLPKFPKKIALVTSNTGAAIQDMKKVAQNRWTLVEITLVPCLVQGESAKDDIVRSIKIANNLDVDVIVVGRGGGSIEDLWAFNEECVADAIFESQVPVVSAVGHENDFVISDFVADIRASTPSNAMEIILPDINDYRQYLDTLVNDFNRNFNTKISIKEQHLKSLKSSFSQNSIKAKFSMVQIHIKDMRNNFNNNLLIKLQSMQQKVKLLNDSFIVNNPSNKDKMGYVQLTHDGKVCELESLKIDEVCELQTSKLVVKAKVVDINHLK